MLPRLCAILLITLQISAYSDPAPVAPTTKPTAQEKASITLSLARRDEMVRVGTPVFVDLTLQNSTEAPLLFPDRRGDGDAKNYLLRVEVNGKSVPLTEHGRRLYKQPAHENLRIIQNRVEPGKTLDVTLELSDIYDISEEGIYTVRASRFVYSADASGMLISVESNSVAIEVKKQ